MIQKRIAFICIPLLCLLCLSWTGASAGQTSSYTRTINPNSARWRESLSIPQFDPAQGRLKAAEVTITGYLDGSIMGQSREETESEIRFVITGDLKLSTENGALLAAVQPQTTLVEHLQASTRKSVALTNGYLVQGQLVQGESSKQVITGQATKTVQITDPAILDRFQGSGELDLPVGGFAKGVFNGPGNVYGSMNIAISAEVRITYIYEGESAANTESMERGAVEDSPAEGGSDKGTLEISVKESDNQIPSANMKNKVYMPLVGS